MTRMKNGKYAELITDIANRIYLDNIEKIIRNYRCRFKSGVTKEIDVCVFLKDGKKIAFEVRDRQGNQSSRWAEQVYGKYEGEEFDYVWICTFGNCNLSSSAIKVADYRKIGWRNININGEYKESNKPIVETEAIQIIPETIELTINGELYKELKAEGINERGEKIDIDLKKQIIKDAKKIIENNFEKFNRISFFENIIDFQIDNIDTNLSKGNNIVKVLIPIEHIIFCDYLSKKFEIEDHNKRNDENILIVSKNNSIFITNKKFVIDLSYIGRLKNENTIFKNSIIINVDEIPEEYRNTKNIKFINMDGKEDIKVYKVVGYKK